MNLEHLWAGWRSAYVTTFGAGEPEGERFRKEAEADSAACVLCRIIASQDDDEARHVVWSGPLTIAILNAFPYAPGHLMVLPRRHLRDLEDLAEDEAADLWSALRRAVAATKSAYRPEGLNVGINLGRSAGAGIPGHLHVHVVARWNGDTSFMTALAGVRVLPEALGESWKKLRAAWD